MNQIEELRKGERGAIIKSPKNRLKAALIYPNTYQVGMSNLGFQAVYGIINSFDDVLCERGFVGYLNTIESGRRITDFDVIAFSVSFESDYLNIYKILIELGIPPFSESRDDNFPIIIAGGAACFLNPEPIAPFIDCFLIGEAEELLPSFFEKIFEKISNDEKPKSNLASLARDIKGVYAPKFYNTIYDKNGFINRREIIGDVPEKIERVFVKRLSEQKPVHSLILTQNTIFDNTFLIEVGRGCPHRCRFCAIGYIYGPPRYIKHEILKESIELGLSSTNNIGLVGANVSDLPDINRLCEHAVSKNIRLSFSSLRANALTEHLINALAKSNVKTATIAPDAGSERMRRVIAKGLNEEEILKASSLLVERGIPNLKLYFMAGLPFETEEDVNEIVILTKKIKKVFLDASIKQKRMGNITVSLNPFVPKPFTPFQWAKIDVSVKRKIKHVINELKQTSNVTVKAETPKQAYIQAALARGDRKVANIIELAYRNKENWTKTLKEAKDIIEFYNLRERLSDEVFPWDFIDHGIKKEYLAKEYMSSGNN